MQAVFTRAKSLGKALSASTSQEDGVLAKAKETLTEVGGQGPLDSRRAESSLEEHSRGGALSRPSNTASLSAAVCAVHIRCHGVAAAARSSSASPRYAIHSTRAN